LDQLGLDELFADLGEGSVDGEGLGGEVGIALLALAHGALDGPGQLLGGDGEFAHVADFGAGGPTGAEHVAATRDEEGHGYTYRSQDNKEEQFLMFAHKSLKDHG